VTLDKTDLKDRTIARSAILKTTIMPSRQGKTFEVELAELKKRKFQQNHTQDIF